MKAILALAGIQFRLLLRSPLSLVALAALAVFMSMGARGDKEARGLAPLLWFWASFYATPAQSLPRVPFPHPALPAWPRQRRLAALLLTALTLAVASLAVVIALGCVFRGTSSTPTAIAGLVPLWLVCLSGAGIGTLVIEWRERHGWVWIAWLSVACLVVWLWLENALRGAAPQALLGIIGVLLAMVTPSVRPVPGRGRAASTSTSAPTEEKSIGSPGRSPVAAYWRLQGPAALSTALLGAAVGLVGLALFAIVALLPGSQYRPETVAFTLMMALLVGATMPALPLATGRSPLLQCAETTTRLPVRPWDLWVHGMLAVPVQVALAGMAALVAAAPVAWLAGKPVTGGDVETLVAGFPAFVGLGLVARGVHFHGLLRPRWLRAVLFAILAVGWLPLPLLALAPSALGSPIATISLGMFVGMGAVVLAAGPRRPRG